MEQKYNDKMKSVGFNQLVCDIFLNWEDVKDEILLPDRKMGSGNGTVHVFLGAADTDLHKEFAYYYNAVEHGEDTAKQAVKVKHYFLKSNVLSMLGYVCQYYKSNGKDYNSTVSFILEQLDNAPCQDGLISTESLFKLSTGSNKLRPYFKQFDEKGVFHKIIRRLLVPGSAYKISLYKNSNNEYAAFWLIGFDDLNNFEADSTKSYIEPANKIAENSDHFQQIFYGAPGTGKSHKIKQQLELENVPEGNIYRTTFHPDSDYSTFVGAYKPTMKNSEPLYNKGQLISKLTELNTQGVSYATQKFGAKYWYSLRRLTPSDEKEILQACGMKESLTVEIDKGVAVGEALLQRKDSRIVYGFVPQVFLNAYTQAYKKPKENIYLIIEEINRGNCAQIFGDLFQLLDRDENGISEYPIKADTDVKTFLESELGVDKPGIKDGELCLPSNLYICATMNTSDQSLFPIDSAFKRRWDWEYEPIKYENTDWVIDIQGEKYLWTSFQKEVNRRIFEATNSEDKQLGDYFVNPRDGVITEKVLVNKILFYLWNDVCKDGEGDIFKVSDTENVSFSELYIDKGKLIKLMDYLHVEKSMNGDKDQSSENEEENDEEAPTTPQSV